MIFYFFLQEAALSRQGSAVCVNKMNEKKQRGGLAPNRPVCAQDPGHYCISDPIIDRFPVGAADEELVLRADEREADGGSACGFGELQVHR